jgi:hypothetical protein
LIISPKLQHLRQQYQQKVKDTRSGFDSLVRH